MWRGVLGQIGTQKSWAMLRAVERCLFALWRDLSRQMTRPDMQCLCLVEDQVLLADIMRVAGAGDYVTSLADAQVIVRAADRIVLLERAAHLGCLLDDLGLEPMSGAEARARLH